MRSWVPIESALVCLNCDVVYETPSQECPRCGSEACQPLHIGRVQEEEEAT